MGRDRRVELEGLFQRDVLGIFPVIRGFADLRDLARISEPYQMSPPSGDGRTTGHQRQLDQQHAKDIKRYFETSSARFIPEIILSVRVETKPINDSVGVQVGVMSAGFDKRRNGIRIRPARKSRGESIHAVMVDPDAMRDADGIARVRRIDGNHRLALAEQLKEDPRVPKKYLAPFCMIILAPPGNAADDYAESIIFHTINSKALPLESEHALRLLLGQDSDFSDSPAREFRETPELHFTRLMRDRLLGLPEEMQARIGGKPLTVVNDAAQAILAMRPSLARGRRAMQTYTRKLYDALACVVPRVWASNRSLCQRDCFIELAARVWEATKGKTQDEHVDEAVKFLEELGCWLGSRGFGGLGQSRSFAEQLIEIFESSRLRVPRRVFLARWYPSPTKEPTDSKKAKLRLKEIRRALADIEKKCGVHLALVDMGTEKGGTGPIHQRMYEAIRSSDIILVDLTGHRPNVHIEAGYALGHHEQGRLLFLFCPERENDKVPFDLSTYRYEPVSEAAEIPEKLGPHIQAILEEAGARFTNTLRK